MGSTKDSIRRKMERHTLLVTGSLSLSPQEGLLQVKNKMMKNAAIAGDFSSPPPSPSSTSHLCLMAKGE
jgi:hypothetical protein